MSLYELLGELLVGLVEISIDSRRSVFRSLAIVLIWIAVVGAIILLQPNSLVTAWLVGLGICATIGTVLISWKLRPERDP